LKKVLALLLAISATWTPSLVAQHAQEKFSSYAPAERILNLDDLKSQLKQYHSCTCKCGCYAKDLDVQAEEKLALILDIDETTLSNYQEMEKAGFAYESKAFNAWVETAQAPAISGTLRLYQEAQKQGVSVFFLTGRPDTQRAATERNLRTQGFQSWQQLILRASTQASATALEYKSAARVRMVAQGYTIALSVGDQWSDLKGKPEAEFSVKYPNPYYLIP